ncbi:hypothetical protein [Lachnoclostridium phytofermentans]|uniref:hypothetical protein n=1 Tax=Lachnoclostridium phytofermentans TaxID=66219 RepID=UPI0004DF864A|nr:hypothetical protein [Lachnoclostridium phytofermentans]
MEERKQLSVSDKNGILNELTRKGYTQEVVDLVKEDLDFGLSQEQTQLYLLKKLDIRQMRVQSQCIRNGYSDDVIAVIMCDRLNGYQMQIALEFFQKGVPLDTIRQIADTGLQAAAMQQAFQKILDEMKKAQDSVKDEPAYVKQLMEEIKGIVSKIDVQDKRYDALNEKLKIFESTKKDEEVKDGLLNSLGEKDQMLSEQQDKINLANSTIAKLRNDIDAIREEKRKMESRVKELEEEISTSASSNVNAASKSNAVVVEDSAAKPVEMATVNQPVKNQTSPVQFIYGTPVYYAPVHDANGNFIQNVVIDKTVKKNNGAFAAISKLLFKKKSRQDIVKLVASGELEPSQLVQIRNAIEKGLSEDQLLELIHSKASAEQMQGVIEIAISINSLVD